MSALVAVVVWRVWDGETVGVVAGVVSMVAGVAALVLAWFALRGAAGPAPLTPQEMADGIAIAVRRRWEAEVKLWRVNDPYTIPVRWEAADPDLFADWSVLEQAARSAGWPAPVRSRWAVRPSELAGSGDGIAGLLEKVPTGRLVILGQPGAGKTILAVRLVLDLLARRALGGPVPVLVPLASWNPAREQLWEWMERRLFLDHPALRTQAPGDENVSWARALWDAGLLLPVLDGLDEINGSAQSHAFAQLNDALRPGVGLVLTARTEPYRAAVQPDEGTPGVVLSGAAGIELYPLDAGVVADYLRASAGMPGAEARWDQVLGVLGDPSNPVGRALASPLMATLARTIYSPRPGESAANLPHPDDLLDGGLDTQAAVERHLFAGFLPAAYRVHPDPERRCPWKPADARRWLVFLAGHLERQRTSDVAWWELDTAVPRPFLRFAVVLMAGLPAAFSVGLPFGLLGGLVTALAFGLPYGLLVGLAVGLPARPALGSALMISFGLAFVLEYGGLIGLLGGLAFGLVGAPEGDVMATANHRPAYTLRWAPSPVWILVGLLYGLTNGLVTALAYGYLYGLLGGLMGGLVALLVLTLPSGLGTRPVEPAVTADTRAVLARDRSVFLCIMISFVILFGFVYVSMIGAWNGLVFVLLFGLAGGLARGLAGGLRQTAWGWFAVARCGLALRGRLPWRLMRFLTDAHQRGVLRQAGAVYQFRHVELQRHLAGQS